VATYGFAQVVIDRSGLSADEDVAVITSHFRRVDNNLPDVFPIIPNTRDNFASNWANWWGIMQAHITSKVKFLELRMYDVPAAPGGLLGDPIDVVPMGMSGTSSSNPLPPQIAASVTFKTAHRLRWGRFYVPGLTSTALEQNGRLATSLIDDLITASAILTDRSGSGGSLTVFSRKYWNHEDPERIQVDDIPDVIRRRRFSAAITKHDAPASP